ncbi:hypothetical protein Pla100_50020 [Neorhodopirellula pilleata]|uniref:Uncharacterized protein n=1 Tax=Neorhodopirellula pilleata TaxID=2714738 RepID=A0A5C5ZX42_9BACT|nr:hypothetical protein Pla100_50020 [Neorhodopirellula pilleata]
MRYAHPVIPVGDLKPLFRSEGYRAIDSQQTQILSPTNGCDGRAATCDMQAEETSLPQLRHHRLVIRDLDTANDLQFASRQTTVRKYIARFRAEVVL